MFSVLSQWTLLASNSFADDFRVITWRSSSTFIVHYAWSCIQCRRAHYAGFGILIFGPIYANQLCLVDSLFIRYVLMSTVSLWDTLIARFCDRFGSVRNHVFVCKFLEEAVHFGAQKSSVRLYYFVHVLPVQGAGSGGLTQTQTANRSLRQGFLG